MTSEPAQHVVAGSWWTSGAGWVLAGWGWLTGGAAPLTVVATVLTVVLTAIKIAQELRAWRKADEEKTALQKVLDRLSRRSTFDQQDKT